MNETILKTIKTLLGIDDSYEYFNSEIIPHINGVLFTLYQLGIIKERFRITSGSETWANLLGEKESQAELIKDYMYWKVKKAFDPPASGTLMEAINQQIAEAEWRLNVEFDDTWAEDDEQ